MPIPGLSKKDMVSIQNREMRTERKLEKALMEIARLKAKIEPCYNELIELLKLSTIKRADKSLYWTLGSKWLVRDSNMHFFYRGDSLIEALKILTKED